MTEKEKLQEYDIICETMAVNIYTLSKFDSAINFQHFDINDKDHLFVLYIANIVAGLSKKDICVKSNLLVRHKLHKLTGKTFGLLKKPKRAEACIDIEQLITDMYPKCKEKLGESFQFTDIYKEFYEQK